MAEITPDAAGGVNVCALLDTIAWAEGTDDNVHPTKDRGYDVLVGGKLFTDYTLHPDVVVRLSPTLASSAAGRYQILAGQWKAYQPILKLPDFSPLSQDLYAINQLRERHAIEPLAAGDFRQAVERISPIWASLPGSPYGQPTHTLDECVAIFVMHGGTYA